ncbi:MAG: hypothetical protein C4K60_14850 [Ideonella sp. MAG2]|nr:MAG: hypothetical protein C4K60_14850 [Ideonella sp. MAG2]
MANAKEPEGVSFKRRQVHVPELGQESEDAALVLRGFGVGYGERQVLRGLDLRLPAHGVTVLLGPSGTGKSTLLKTLAGHLQGLSSHWVVGDIIHAPAAGAALPPLAVQKAGLLMATLRDNLLGDWAARAQLTPAQQTAYLAEWLDHQGLGDMAARLAVPVVELTPAQQALTKLLRVLLPDAPLVLLDEPTAGLGEEEAEPLLEVISRVGRQRAVLVSMHHLAQSRRIAHRVLLLASGRLQEDTPASAFFLAPRSESGRLFLATGSCPEESAWPQDLPALSVCPRPAAPTLIAAPQHSALPVQTLARGPQGFVWLLDGQLAGTAMPGLLRPVEDDLRELSAAGITRLLSLTTRPCDAEAAARWGIQVRALPIVDMGAPTLDEALMACQWLDACLADQQAVAVHCRAGLGRTGTILGCYLLWRKGGRLSAAQALSALRHRQNAWVQSQRQEEFLHEFALAMARQAVPDTMA